ncbi:hypothetical protein [Paraburkholderia hiiakae]
MQHGNASTTPVVVSAFDRFAHTVKKTTGHKTGGKSQSSQT